jgi:hypothetical protein
MEAEIAAIYERVKRKEITYEKFKYEAQFTFMRFMNQFPEIEKKNTVFLIQPILKNPYNNDYE